MTPKQPDDLRIIVEDLRAFMSSNIPSAMCEQFPLAIERLLVSYVTELQPKHPQDAWDCPAELMRRTFNDAPSLTLCNAVQTACLRLPLDFEERFWTLCRCLRAEGAQGLVRAWLLRHSPSDVPPLEVAATRLQQATGEHAAALDLMRWAEVTSIGGAGQGGNSESLFRALYFKVLRHTAEERAASATRLAVLGSSSSSAIDLQTKQHVLDSSRPPASFPGFPAQLTGEDLTLCNLTQTEASILREYLSPYGEDANGDATADDPLGGSSDEHSGLLTPIKDSALGDEGGGQLVSTAHVDYAMTLLEFHPQLKERIPGRHHAHGHDGGWNEFVRDLFLVCGYAQFGARMRAQLDRAYTDGAPLPVVRKELCRVIDRLQQLMRSEAASHRLPDEPSDRLPSEGDSDFVAEAGYEREGEDGYADAGDEAEAAAVRLQILFEEFDVVALVASPEHIEPGHAADLLAFEMGQRAVWQEGFIEVSAEEPNYYDAPSTAQAHLLSAFAHASTCLGSPTASEGAGGLLGDEPLSPIEHAAHDALQKIDDCEEIMYNGRPHRALVQVEALLDATWPHEDVGAEKLAYLHCMCGDAWMALDQPGRAIAHFSRLHGPILPGGGTLRQPLDAQLECVCAMLSQKYPPQSVINAVQNGGANGSATLASASAANVEGPLLDGWQLLTRVLVEVNDTDVSGSAAAAEEDRSVGKLLMYLGNNVTNRRERDARIQRALQDSASGGAAGTVAKRPGTTRRHRQGGDAANDDSEALYSFWQGLPAEQRLELCRVSKGDMDHAIAGLAASFVQRESAKDAKDARKEQQSNEEENPGVTGDILVQQLHASLLGPNELEGGGDGFGGLALIDCLCDLESLSEMGGAYETSHAARGLFRFNGERVDVCLPIEISGQHTTTWPMPDGVSGKDDEAAAALGPRGGQSSALSLGPRDASDSLDELSVLLERLMTVEAAFDAEAGAQSAELKAGLGTQLGYEQSITLVRAMRALSLAAASLL